MKMLTEQKNLKRYVSTYNDCFKVRFDYEPSIVEIIRNIPGRRWLENGRFWVIPANITTRKHIKELNSIGFKFLDDAKKLLKEEVTTCNGVVGISKNKKGKKFFGIKFYYNELIVNFIRQVDGRTWNPTKKYWRVPINGYSSTKMLELQNEFKFRIFDSATEEIVKAINSGFKIDEKKLEGLNGTLRDFQKKGVKFIVNKKEVIVGDQMGLGKTIEALASLHYLNAFPSIVICPSSVKLNWERETNKWLPNKKVLIVDGQNNKNLKKDFDVYIINYDILWHNLKVLNTINFKSAVVDESQFCKNEKSKRTLATQDIIKTIKYKILLTGTPIRNRPHELISQLKIIKKLSDFGGWHGFVYNYCDPQETQWGLDIKGSSNIEKLNTVLRSTCYIRRTKKEVLKELPDKIISLVPVKIDNRIEYECAKDKFSNWFYDGFKNSKTRRPSAGTALVKLVALTQITAAGKLNFAINWISDFISSDEKLVVFAHHRKIVNTIYEKFKDISVKIQGGMSNIEKQKSIDSFQDDESIKIIVISIMAGGIGINLTAASNAVFIEQTWSPADLEQAEDRLHRIGQKNNVNYYYLIAKNTVDEVIAKTIANKKRIFSGVVDGKINNNAFVVLDKFLKHEV